MGEIENLEEKIRYTKEQIQKHEDMIEEAGDDGIRVADSTRASLVLRKRLLYLEQELQALQLKEMEEKIEAQYENDEIDEKGYTDKKTEIYKYSETWDDYKDWQDTEIDIGLAELSNGIGAREMRQLKAQAERQKRAYDDKMKDFKEKFTERQVREGKLDEQQRQEILSQEHYGQEDIVESFNDLSENMGEVNQEKKSTLDLIKDTYHGEDVRDVVAITDNKTKEQLCALYGIRNPEEIEIYAVHTYDETKLKDSWLGKNISAYKDSNEPIGDFIQLSYYDNRTGAMGSMVNGDVDLQGLSADREVEIADVNGSLEENSLYPEIGTYSYSGLKLTYYKDENGMMRIARGNNGRLQEIDTENLTEIEHEKQMEQSKAKLDKLNIVSKRRTPEEIKNLKMEEIHSMSAEEAMYCINQLDSAEDRFDFALGLPIGDKEYDGIRDLVALDEQEELQSINPLSQKYQEKQVVARANRAMLMKHMSQEWKEEHADELKKEFPDWVLSKSRLTWDGKFYRSEKTSDLSEKDMDEMDPPGDDDPLNYDETLDELDPLGDDDPLNVEDEKLNIPEDALMGYATDYMSTMRYLETRTDLSKGERDDLLEGEMYDSFMEMVVADEEGLGKSQENLQILYEQYGREFKSMIEGKKNEINENARNVREDLFINSKDVSLDEKQSIEMYEMREVERQEQENQETVEGRRGLR